MKIVVIGGGTGNFVVLKGLQKYSKNLVSVVSMADSGGSAKKERDEWGLLPVSDVRKAMLALAEEDNERTKLLRELFNYRFSEGVGIKGMTFGNLLLVALTNILGDQSLAIRQASQLLSINGEILPITCQQSNLVLEYTDGKVIVGEHLLDKYLENFPEDEEAQVANLYLLPPARANPKVIEALKNCRLIIFPPGDLYGSVIANLAIQNIADAVRSSRAKKIYVMNLVTKFGQTQNYKASHHVQELERYAQINLDHILINNAPLPKKALTYYAREKDYPVYDNLKNDSRVIRGDFLAEIYPEKQKGDELKRSLIRHDPAKLAGAITHLFPDLFNSL